MTSFNVKIFSKAEEKWNKAETLSSKSEDITIKANFNCPKITEKNNIKSLLTGNENILNSVELDSNLTQFSKEFDIVDNSETNYLQDLSFNQISNESRFFIENEVQYSNNNDRLKSVRSKHNVFKQYGKDICGDLNDSVNLLKSKLFTPYKDEVIPIKRKYLDFGNTNLQPYPVSFYGLPNRVKELIKNIKGIDKLYDWQNECLSMKVVNDRQNFIYALPTSGGKTLVAEILMLKEIICYKRNAIFILPFVALVQEKVQSLIPFALELNFLIEEYAAEKGHYPPRKRRKKNSIYICTIEKAQSIINCLIELDRLNEIGIIVVDELHLLGESGGRGATLECLLTKVIHVNSNIQIIGMSATIGNLKEISTFLNAEMYVHNFRPIAIKEYVKCESEIWLVDSRTEELFTDKKIINYKYSEKALQLDPDYLGGLVMDVVPNDSCLIFCSSKKNCENVAMLLTRVLFKSLESHKVDEKLVLLNALKNESDKICPILKKTIKFGVAYHHSGLTAEERRLLEEAFRSGILCVISCTSTLAAGVNLPARRVILRSPYIGLQFLNISRYKQMIGRAGRAGMGEIGESILICTRKDIVKIRELLSSKMDEAITSLHIEKDRGMNNIIISSVLLSIAKTRFDLHNILSKTLLNINIKEVTDKALVSLLKSGIIRAKEKNSADTTSQKLDSTVIFPTQNNALTDGESTSEEKEKKKCIVLINSTELELCPLGRAAMKGSIELRTAYTLYEDLKTAQTNLILVDHLHLMYLITPYDIASQINPVGTVFYDVIMSLPTHQMKVAKLLGINEAVVDKLRAGITPKYVDKKVVQRFYVTLMLHELWNHQSILNVADKYQVNRGTVQHLLSSTSSFASSTVRFCQELEEFWAFRDLLMTFGQKLTYCCASELEPLMELPYVKLGRARQLYKAGYKTLQLIAKAKPEEMIERIEHLSTRLVSKIVSAAKLLLLEKVENLRDEVEEVLDGLDI
ncbi:PREDICTED: helicase POLQ-like [Ceratosolen solmsi marchali]|uniref:Helicase POLQ-like n=1 Tax=Ceratosolen solmsi marchali TaxID=326594 RepID=A0AAJ6YBM2_9HYME|nr:PREDICTED: helicase POLQ-like [Ceratosolen solmsi marchali]